jgi:hypothetical protein
VVAAKVLAVGIDIAFIVGRGARSMASSPTMKPYEQTNNRPILFGDFP